MNASVIKKRNFRGKLKLKYVKIPQITDDDVLIRVVAVGVNEIDLQYEKFKDFNGIPGLECSGIIEAIGENVRGWIIGDRVCAILDGGGYAEKVVVPSTQIFPVPKHVSLLDAATLPYAACLTWLALFKQRDKIEIRPRKKEIILIYEGASSLGVMAIQIAKHKGMIVIACEGTDEKILLCRNMGADICLNHTKGDLYLKVIEATDGKGVDFVLDNEAFRICINLDCCAHGAKVLIVGSHGMKDYSVNLTVVMARRLQIKVLDFKIKEKDYKKSIIKNVKLELWPAIEKEMVKPTVYRYMPLSEAAKAHKFIKSKVSPWRFVLFT